MFHMTLLLHKVISFSASYSSQRLFSDDDDDDDD